MITLNHKPDYSAICRLRRENEKKAEADALYKEDRRRGDELSPWLGHQENRVGALQRAKEEQANSTKRTGRKLKEPNEMPDEGAKANLTGVESRIMKTHHGYIQRYNVQAMVTKQQIIVGAKVT